MTDRPAPHRHDDDGSGRCAMTPERLAEIREHASIASTYAEYQIVAGRYVPELLAYVDELLASDHDAERELTERIVAHILQIAAAQTDPDECVQAFRRGLLIAAGEAKVEHLFEPDGSEP